MDNQQHMIVNNEAGPELGAQLPLTDLELEEYGLSGADRQAVEALADRIDERNPLSIAEFGHDIGEHTANYTDELLDQVKNADLEDLGEQLSLLVMSAKHINLSPFADRSSKIPLIGRYLDRAKMTKDRLGATIRQHQGTNR